MHILVEVYWVAVQHVCVVPDEHLEEAREFADSLNEAEYKEKFHEKYEAVKEKALGKNQHGYFLKEPFGREPFQLVEVSEFNKLKKEKQ